MVEENDPTSLVARTTEPPVFKIEQLLPDDPSSLASALHASRGLRDHLETAVHALRAICVIF